jgi:hypothetical protein
MPKNRQRPCGILILARHLSPQSLYDRIASSRVERLALEWLQLIVPCG